MNWIRQLNKIKLAEECKGSFSWEGVGVLPALAMAQSVQAPGYPPDRYQKRLSVVLGRMLLAAELELVNAGMGSTKSPLLWV